MALEERRVRKVGKPGRPGIQVEKLRDCGVLSWVAAWSTWISTLSSSDTVIMYMYNWWSAAHSSKMSIIQICCGPLYTHDVIIV